MSNLVLDLSKKFELNLEKAGFTQIPVMRTRLAVDKSGSMDDLYNSGFVEKTVELFMGAAAKFDDNGELEYTFFDYDASDIKSVGVDSYKSIRIPRASSGTNYVPALKELVDLGGNKQASGGGIFGMFKKPPAPQSNDPVYIGFITDGEPGDKSETINFLIDELQGTRNFVQFIVLGNGVSKSTMESMTRTANTAYAVIQNPSKMTVDELYDIIANQKLLNWYKTL